MIAFPLTPLCSESEGCKPCSTCICAKGCSDNMRSMHVKLVADSDRAHGYSSALQASSCTTKQCQHRPKGHWWPMGLVPIATYAAVTAGQRTRVPEGTRREASKGQHGFAGHCSHGVQHVTFSHRKGQNSIPAQKNSRFQVKKMLPLVMLGPGPPL